MIEVRKLAAVDPAWLGTRIIVPEDVLGVVAHLPCHAAIFNVVIEYRSATLDRTFAALAHPTRRAIVRQLSGGALTVTEVAAPHPVSLAAVSKHLDVLEEAGLVRRTREGRVQRCSLVSAPLAETSRWVEQYRSFWEQQLGALSRYLVARRRRS